MSVTIELEPVEEKRLRTLAEEQGQSVESLVHDLLRRGLQEAAEHLSDEATASGSPEGATLYDAWKDFIGVVASQHGNDESATYTSAQSKELFLEYLEEKKRMGRL